VDAHFPELGRLGGVSGRNGRRLADVVQASLVWVKDEFEGEFCPVSGGFFFALGKQNSQSEQGNGAQHLGVSFLWRKRLFGSKG
jgi:hypothetical protein